MFRDMLLKDSFFPPCMLATYNKLVYISPKGWFPQKIEHVQGLICCIFVSSKTILQKIYLFWKKEACVGKSTWGRLGVSHCDE